MKKITEINTHTKDNMLPAFSYLAKNKSDILSNSQRTSSPFAFNLGEKVITFIIGGNRGLFISVPTFIFWILGITTFIILLFFLLKNHSFEIAFLFTYSFAIVLGHLSISTVLIAINKSKRLTSQKSVQLAGEVKEWGSENSLSLVYGFDSDKNKVFIESSMFFGFTQQRGQKVDVYYDPNIPSYGVVKKRHIWVIPFSFVTGFLVSIIINILLVGGKMTIYYSF